MTTAFEPTSSAAHSNLPWSINQAADPYSVYNSLSRAAARKEQSTATPDTTRHDTASISATSAALSVADPVSRNARLAALRQSIANGTYAVSAYRVSGSLLQSLL